MTTAHSWMEVVVTERKIIATDVARLTFASPDGADLPPFSAGSHIDVEVAPGLVRQYSLSNNPSDRKHYVIGVLRDPASRGGSAGVHGRIDEGKIVRISEPRNHFPLQPGATMSLLFAGGIGITPILCMAERLAHSGEAFEMHYCCRSPDRAAFRDVIQSGGFSDQVQFHFDDGLPEQKLDLQTILAGYQPGAHLYVCGPCGFIDVVIMKAQEHGWPAESRHREYFTPPAPAEEAGSDRAFNRAPCQHWNGVRYSCRSDDCGGSAGCRHRDSRQLRAGSLRAPARPACSKAHPITAIIS